MLVSLYQGVSYEHNRNAIPLALHRTAYLADLMLLDVVTQDVDTRVALWPRPKRLNWTIADRLVGDRRFTGFGF